jgi:hypothetical protein
LPARGSYSKAALSVRSSRRPGCKGFKNQSSCLRSTMVGHERRRHHLSEERLCGHFGRRPSGDRLGDRLRSRGYITTSCSRLLDLFGNVRNFPAMKVTWAFLCRCSGLQTATLGPANKGCFRLTFGANTLRLGPTITANEPIFRLLGTFGEYQVMTQPVPRELSITPLIIRNF